MRNSYLGLLALAVFGVFLAACGGMELNAGSENAAESAVGSESPGSPPGEQISMIIGPELVDCVGEGPQPCMQVKFDPDEEWQYFYSQIEGFDYQSGYRYTLLVERLEVQNPPAGGSSLRYVLVELLEKVEELSMSAGNLAGELAGTYWVLDGIGNLDQPQGVLEKVLVSLQYDPEQGRLSGSAGCNNYFGEVKIDQDQGTFSAGPLGMTRMACSEQIMAQESAYINLLGQITRFAIQDGALYLFSEDGEVLTFSPGEKPAGRQ